MNLLRNLVVLFLLFIYGLSAHADDLGALNESFWRWRAQEQPFTSDDIPRIERPDSFIVDWSSKTISGRLEQLYSFEQRWQRLAPPAGTSIHDQVDYRLLGSAIARVRWELSIEQTWRRDPEFYVYQTLGSVFALLLQPPPFSPSRQQQIVDRHEADSSDDSGSKRESVRHTATLCGVGNRSARSSGRPHSAHGNGSGSSAHRGQLSGASGCNARSNQCTQRLPCMAPEDSAEHPQRHRDWPRKLSLFPEKRCAASIHPGAVARHESSGMEPFGRVRNVSERTPCRRSTGSPLFQRRRADSDGESR